MCCAWLIKVSSHVAASYSANGKNQTWGAKHGGVNKHLGILTDSSSSAQLSEPPKLFPCLRRGACALVCMRVRAPQPPQRKLSLMSSVKNMAASLCASWLLSPGEARCDNKYRLFRVAGSRSKHETLKPTEALNFNGVTLCANRDSQPLFTHKKVLYRTRGFWHLHLKWVWRGKNERRRHR